MGTDISLFVERRKKDRWVSCDKWKYGHHLTLGDIVQDVPGDAAFYSDRNYDLFAILADVRNGYGFAGLDTGDGFNVMTKPRGLPNDLSPEVAELAEWVFEKDHTTGSWLVLSEILAFDWKQTTVKRGFVNGPEYAEWIRTGRDRRSGKPV